MQTPDDRPKAVELEILITLSMSLGTRMIGITGPKVSCITSSRGVGNVVDDGRRIERAVAVVAMQQPGPVLDGIIDAALELLGGAFVNHGADIDRGIHRIAAFQLSAPS